MSDTTDVLHDLLLEMGIDGAELLTPWHLKCLAACVRAVSQMAVSRLSYDMLAGTIEAVHAEALVEHAARGLPNIMAGMYRRMLTHGSAAVGLERGRLVATPALGEPPEDLIRALDSTWSR